MKTINDYTTDELIEELNRRIAMQTKEMFDIRTEVTKHIRRHKDVYFELADIMKSDDLRDTIKKIDDLVYNCINLNIMIEDGKEFMDGVFNDPDNPNVAIWTKYNPGCLGTTHKTEDHT